MSVLALLMGMDALSSLFDRHADDDAGGVDQRTDVGDFGEDILGFLQVPEDAGADTDALGLADKMDYDAIDGAPEEKAASSIVIDEQIINLADKMDYDSIDGAPEERAADDQDDYAPSIVIEDVLIGLADKMDYDAIDGAPEEKGRMDIVIEDIVMGLADKMDYDSIDGAPEERERGYIIIEDFVGAMNKGDLINKVAESAG